MLCDTCSSDSRMLPTNPADRPAALVPAHLGPDAHRGGHLPRPPGSGPPHALAGDAPGRWLGTYPRRPRRLDELFPILL